MTPKSYRRYTYRPTRNMTVTSHYIRQSPFISWGNCNVMLKTDKPPFAFVTASTDKQNRCTNSAKNLDNKSFQFFAFCISLIKLPYNMTVSLWPISLHPMHTGKHVIEWQCRASNLEYQYWELQAHAYHMYKNSRLPHCNWKIHERTAAI